MSETVLKFLVSELRIVRIICQNNKCAAVVETTVDDLDRYFRGWCCPLCKEPFRHDDLGNNFLTELQNALRGLKKIQDKVQVEFVLPVKNDK